MSLKQEAPIAESENQNAEQLTEEQFLFRVSFPNITWFTKHYYLQITITQTIYT